MSFENRQEQSGNTKFKMYTKKKWRTFVRYVGGPHNSVNLPFHNTLE